ncbi:Epsin-2 [Orchesella cincta]|uniref:Epsin-2 n=1 Tax=Orchesella cincta TaxID=48709 RepID=A0A1D2MA09_ORCCI|nr:Epsin-2 [Orchesella cincta]
MLATNFGEEELQLQLALAMSKEEADQEEKQRRSDELRLQMALSQSEQEFKTKDGTPIKKEGSALVDLLDLELGAAGGAPPMHHGIVEDVLGGDPWAPLKRTDGGGPTDPWSGSSSTVTSPQDPWGGGAVGGAAAAVILGLRQPLLLHKQLWIRGLQITFTVAVGARAASANGLGGDDEFSVLSKRTSDSGAALNLDPLGPALLTPMNNHSGSRSNNASPTILGSGGRKKDPLEFLGENSNLVNLDNLVPANSSSSSLATSTLIGNPFAPPGAAAAVPTQSLLTTGANGGQTVNPFQIQNQVAKPSINEIREKQQQNQLTGLGLGLSPISPVPMQQQQPARSSQAVNNPWSPVKTENPFLN